jgi:hypothetical protein
MISIKHLVRSTNREATRYVVSQVSHYLLTLRPQMSSYAPYSRTSSAYYILLVPLLY